ncbi:MAG: SPOR domain-containing protein [Thioalkalivibrio sp.]|nr:MAG: SPOR domain-containing protein [Thioalkalivibrio sp.]
MAQARKVRRKPASTRSRRPTPGWVWLLAGVLVGLAVAAALYLQGADRMGQDPGWLTRDEGPAAAPTPQPLEGPPAAASERSRFQFYELLPQDEVRIPEAAPPPSRTAAPTPAPAAEPAPTPEPTPEPETRPEPDAAARVMLQTGSFQRYEQADQMKARLAMMGLQASIREVEVGGQTFHRVYLGPFDNEAVVNRWTERLQREDFEVLRLPAF